MDAEQVLDIIHNVLRLSDHPRLRNAHFSYGLDNQKQLVITTHDGNQEQTWIMDSQSILASDN